MTTTRHERPTGAPGGTDLAGRPAELTEDQLAIAHQAGASDLAGGPGGPERAAPLLHPPGTVGATAGTATPAGSWQTKQVLALYTTQTGRSGWVYLDGVGWRGLATANDSAHDALGMLAAAARAAGSSVQARDETDGQLHEIYLW